VPSQRRPTLWRDYATSQSGFTLSQMAQILQAKFRLKPDLWLTISGWIWLAYAAALLVLLTATTA
jgi:hypothetical protein